jgi:hypothetical protein
MGNKNYISKRILIESAIRASITTGNIPIIVQGDMPDIDPELKEQCLLIQNSSKKGFYYHILGRMSRWIEESNFFEFALFLILFSPILIIGGIIILVEMAFGFKNKEE